MDSICRRTFSETRRSSQRWRATTRTPKRSVSANMAPSNFQNRCSSIRVERQLGGVGHTERSLSIDHALIRTSIDQRSSPLQLVFVGPGAVDLLYVSRLFALCPWLLKNKHVLLSWQRAVIFKTLRRVDVPSGRRHTADTQWWPQRPPASSTVAIVRSLLQQKDDRSKFTLMKQYQNMKLSQQAFLHVVPEDLSVLSRAAPKTLKHKRTSQNTKQEVKKYKQTVNKTTIATSVTRGPRTEREGQGLWADSRPWGSDSRFPSGSSSSKATPWTHWCWFWFWTCSPAESQQVPDHMLVWTKDDFNASKTWKNKINFLSVKIKKPMISSHHSWKNNLKVINRGSDNQQHSSSRRTWFSPFIVHWFCM